MLWPEQLATLATYNLGIVQPNEIGSKSESDKLSSAIQMKPSKIPAGKLREDLEFLKFFHSSRFMKDLHPTRRPAPAASVMCDASRERLYNFKAIRCTQPTCRCECFSPGKSFLRTCDTCKHGWVSHALEKLGYRTMHQLGMQVEIVQPNIVFDIASLILYGAQAAPIRLKILLDRLFSVLQHDEVLQVLHGFGWSYEDYARGYILQDPSGRVLDKWLVTTREEEQVILQQFLRFGETKSIAQEIILQDARDNRDKQNFQMSPKSESEIKKFIERSNIGMQSFMRGYDPRSNIGKPMPMPMPFSLSPTPGNAAAAAAAAAAVAARMFTPPNVPNMPSPATTPVRDRGGMLLPVSPANIQLTGSPLTRLQTMQPVDYRSNHTSPMPSPGSAEKKAPTAAHDHRSPQNLSVAATAPISVASSLSLGMFTPMSIPVKPEIHETVHTATPKTNNVVVSCTGSPIKPDNPAMEGVLNFSLKDMKNLPISSPQQLQTPPAQVSPPPHSPRASSTSASSSNSPYADQKIKHLRKSSNPMKRPWQPTPGYGGTLISPSGKKRVLCTACNKTFCDKGALKIHYSAVHLKEMHKCSVEGCHMMFSSRRSRNRHSANPNPKLHMPQARRKLPDGTIGGMMDDTGSDGSPPPHIPAVMPGLMSSPLVPIEPPEPCEPQTSCVPVPVEPVAQPKVAEPTTEQLAQINKPAAGKNAAGEMIYYLDPSALAGIPTQLLPSPPKPVPQDGAEQPSKDGESSTKGRSSSKRKRLIPTRCAQLDDSFVLSDDDGVAILDDSSENGELGKRLRKNASPESNDGNKSNENDSSEDDEDGIYDDDSEGVIGEMVSSEDDEISSVSCNSPLKAIAADSQDKHFQSPIGSNADVGKKSLNYEERLDCKNEKSTTSEEDSADVANMDDVETNDGDRDDGKMQSFDDEDEGSGQDKDEDMDIEGLDDIPLDKENPKNCQACGKIFLNLFALKLHYQNVHLKLMHKCRVEGCNAAFPSKRSRDRHSSNINLHRKLLSTSSSDNEMNVRNMSLREEFLPRIYDNQQLPETFQSSVNHTEGGMNGNSETNNNNSGLNAMSDEEMPLVNGKDSVQQDIQDTSDEDSGVDQQDGDSDDTEVYNNQTSLSNGEIDINRKIVGPEPDPNGSVTCHVCINPFRDNLVLKEHFEMNHPKEMFHCTIRGCDKIFSTRKSRNRHSQNDNLHRHISPTKINGEI